MGASLRLRLSLRTAPDYEPASFLLVDYNMEALPCLIAVWGLLLSKDPLLAADGLSKIALALRRPFVTLNLVLSDLP